MRAKVWLISCTLFSLSASVVGCGERQELATNLDTRQSIELVVVLKGVGINSQRERMTSSREGKYSVLVSGAEYLRALQVMHEYRLPSEREEEFEKMTSAQGILPNTPEMNRLRLDRALGLQLERLLSALPGVLDSKTIVRTSSGESSGQTPSVVVVLRYTSPSGTVPFSIDDVKRIAAKTVPQVDPESITVRADRIFAPPLLTSEGGGSDTEAGRGSAGLVQLRPFPFRVQVSERLKAYAQIGVLLLGATLSGMILGGALVYSSRRKAKPRRSTASKELMPQVVSRSGTSTTLASNIGSDSVTRRRGGRDLS